ncbi:glycosyltransferase [Klebsiella pneumoniae]
MSNLKVLFVDTCHDVAGGQRSLIALLSNVDNKFKYNVMIHNGNKKYLNELLANGVPRENIILINAKPLGLKILGGVKLFFKCMTLAKKYSLMHCNTFFDGLFAMPSFRLQAKKTIFRARCGIDLSNHGIVDNVIYHNASVILANSEYVKTTFSRINSNLAKIDVIYNPLDLKFYRDFKNITNEKKKIIAVIGAITEVKNQMEVLKAFSLIDNENIFLRFIGEPRSTDKDRLYNDELMSFIKKHNLENRIEFSGFVSDVRTQLQDVDLVCVPSDREPLGRVIFETQLFNIPVLASNSGGNEELIIDGKTGYLYELGNIDQLKEKMLKVNSPNEKLINDAQKFVLERFSPDKTYLAEFELYERLSR